MTVAAWEARKKTFLPKTDKLYPATPDAPANYPRHYNGVDHLEAGDTRMVTYCRSARFVEESPIASHLRVEQFKPGHVAGELVESASVWVLSPRWKEPGVMKTPHAWEHARRQVWEVKPKREKKPKSRAGKKATAAPRAKAIAV